MSLKKPSKGWALVSQSFRYLAWFLSGVRCRPTDVILQRDDQRLFRGRDGGFVVKFIIRHQPDDRRQRVEMFTGAVLRPQQQKR